MNFYLSAVLLGLGYASLAMGIFISMRIFNIPDITTDGSFTLGGALTAVLMTSVNPLPLPVIFLVAFIAGAMAGSMTGIIHTKLKVNALLSGIIVMTALFSVNISLMGRSNIPLLNVVTLFDYISLTDNNVAQRLIVLVMIISIVLFLLSRLLRTDFGLAMRATGNNENMIRAQGVNTDAMKITGLALANGLIAISGFLFTQQSGFADINMGVGSVILGLGSVMIGEILLKLLRIKKIAWHILGAVLGSIMFQLILAFALTQGINTNYLKLVTAVFVLVVVSIPNLKTTTA
jgi:putative ABC transport system permease protein